MVHYHQPCKEGETTGSLSITSKVGTALNYMNAAMDSEHLIRDTLAPVTAKEWT